ncbi:MAG: SusC/RagA family TonB-linked outer membrane protein, partial [Bacteroidales bacterium]|nr:SusC/RagA family TonB-linked outer membrane protein [Bacteroidales bacterium]
IRAIGVQNPLASLRSLDPSFVMLDNDTFGSNPNQMPNIEIRGKSSMLGLRDELSEDPNQPLFILDGFESTLSAIYNLDVSRIESITILKDAASTAMYGSKAANGVVVVETVKPVAGKLRLSYSGSLDVTAPDLSSYNLMNANEKLEFERLAGHYDSSGSAADIIELDNLYNKRLASIQSGTDTYWLSEPLRIGVNNRHDLYVDGGADGFMFGIGLNVNDVNGVMKNSNRNGLGGRIDLTYRIGNLNFSNKFSALSTLYSDPIVPFSEYAMANPYCKKYAEDGSIQRLLFEGTSLEYAMGNPMWNDSLNSRNDSKDLLISDYFNVEYNPLEGLRLRARAGLTYNTHKNENFISPDDTRFENTNRLRRGSFTSTDRGSMKYEGDFTASYGKVFDRIHNVNLALGGKISESKTLSNGYTVYGFPSGDFTYPSFSNGYGEGARPTYTESVVREASAYVIGSYALKDRYLLDASYRLNGASVFGSNKKYINTWSVGLGWNIHKEKFMQNASIINFWKIRGSIGNPGNTNFDSSMSLTTYRYSFASYNYFGLSTTLEQLGNVNLMWQTTLDRNIGMDLTMFNNRLNLTLDAYRKDTDPLLLAIGLPSSSGVTSYYTNCGTQISKGFTGTAQYYIFRDFTRRITWSVRASLRLDGSELRNLGNTLESFNKYSQSRTLKRYFDGADPDDIWAVRSAGIDPATGRELFIKKDGTYSYDFSYEDEVVVGNERPDAEGVIGTNFSFKGFTFGTTFRYRLGADTFNNAVFSKVENISSSNLLYNQDKRALYDRWQKVGDISQFKNIASSSSTPMSSRFVQTENTLSLESFQIGYEFEPELARKLGLEGLRLNAYMNNIFRLSTIKEERGISYPYAKSVTFALSLTF